MVFARMRQRIAVMLQKYDGCLNFATDAWTAPNHHTYVAITVHLEHEGKPLAMVLDIVEELADMVPDYSDVNCLQCFLHVVNLVAKALIKQFDAVDAIPSQSVMNSTENDTEDAAENTAESTAKKTALDDDKDSNGNDTKGEDSDGKDSDGKDDLDDPDDATCPLVLAKLRKLSFKLIHSMTILGPVWKRCLADLKMDYRIMPPNVTTCWNSTYDMLDFTVKYRNVLDKMTSDRKNDLCKYEVDDNDWKLAEQLHNMLEILKEATQYFSRAKPNLAHVVPAIDAIHKEFSSFICNPSIPDLIREAVQMVKKVLNQYYSKTDDIEIYWIAMVLHPRHKLAYFSHAGWELEWVNMARELVEQEYERNYKNLESAEGGEHSKKASKVHLYHHCSHTLSGQLKFMHKASTSMKHINRFNALASLTPLTTYKPSDELRWYLQSDPEDV
ncbi:hypothetical protein AX14_002970 [Amanita brunnescens Koide BX004]|nr:hypothetical protein AX14_002970 [Amanita brunnescens Koide BX004]